MQCSNCNAGLSAEQMRGDDCPFCGTALPHQAEAIKTGATIKELLRDSDGDGIPDIAAGLGRRVDSNPETDFGGLERATAAATRPGWRQALPAVLVFAAILVAALVFSADDPLGTGLRDLRTLTQECLVDANGDGVLDVAAYAPGLADKGAHVVLLDGLDGKVLWKSDAQPGAARLDCLGDGWLLLSFGDFHSELFHAVTPGKTVALRGSDALHSFGRNADCLTIKTDDGESSSYTLPSGAPSDCRVRGLTRRGEAPNNHLEAGRKSATDTQEGTSATLTKRSKGSPILTVELRGNQGDNWTSSLPFVAPTFSSAVALTKGQVFVWGAPPGKRADVVLIGLNRKNGEQHLTRPFPQPGTTILNFFEWNGKHLLVGFMGGLHAIDPVTGETAWTKGSTGMGGVFVPSQFRDL